MLFCKKNYKPVYHLKIDKATHFSCFGKPDETCSVSGKIVVAWNKLFLNSVNNLNSCYFLYRFKSFYTTNQVLKCTFICTKVRFEKLTVLVI